MERAAIAVQVKRLCAALLMVAAAATAAPFPARGASTGSDLSLDLRHNVVRVTALWKSGAVYDGFGFVVGARNGSLYVVTADHVVRGDGPDAIDQTPKVSFFDDQGKEYKTELLATRLPPWEGDVAVLRLEAPAGLTWRRAAVAAGRARRGTSLWFVGLQRDWFVPIQPGFVNRIEPGGSMIAEGLNIRVGTSGAPLISDAGIVGMVVADSGTFARATPVELIERAVKDWGYPWELTAAPAPLHECDRLAASPYDAGKNPQAAGVEIKKIDVKKAIPACREAVQEDAVTARFAFQLGRALAADGNFGDAFLWYRRAADAGYAVAQSNLGVMYADGKGLAKDEAQAVRLYRLAADQGSAVGQTNLGFMHANGRGGVKDDAEAVRLYRLAADQGYPRAWSNLGFMYEQGRGGLAKDDAEAVRLYRLATDQGYAQAQNNLGAMYANGRGGLVKDDAEAVRLYRLAADQGNAQAQNNLGAMYANGRGGLVKDDAQAVRLYRLSADQGHAQAQNNLGAMYANGRGGLVKDDAEAVRLYRLAANQGNALAQGNLGTMHEQGRGGLVKDDVEAVRLYRLAADQGSAIGQNNLGNMYANGRGGVVKDDVEAVRLYRLAADQGTAAAQANLGLMYEYGRGGLAKDDAEALRLYRRAADQGNDWARNALERLGKTTK
jgi:TPR repeat protein